MPQRHVDHRTGSRCSIRKFTERVPFQAILSLNAEEGGQLHEFIRIGEGPLHDAIVMKHLPPKDRSACREGARRNRQVDPEQYVTNVKSDAYVAPDFLTLDFGDEDGGRVPEGREEGGTGARRWLSAEAQRGRCTSFPMSGTRNDDDPPKPGRRGKREIVRRIETARERDHRYRRSSRQRPGQLEGADAGS